jgi:hypothetical protein
MERLGALREEGQAKWAPAAAEGEPASDDMVMGLANGAGASRSSDSDSGSGCEGEFIVVDSDSDGDTEAIDSDDEMLWAGILCSLRNAAPAPVLDHAVRVAGYPRTPEKKEKTSKARGAAVVFASPPAHDGDDRDTSSAPAPAPCRCAVCGDTDTPQWRKGWDTGVLSRTRVPVRSLLCNACGLKYNKGHICQVCHKHAAVANDKPQVAGCQQCSRRVHVACEIEKYDTFAQPLRGKAEKSRGYYCPTCRSGSAANCA